MTGNQPASRGADLGVRYQQAGAGQLAVYGTRGMPAWRYPSLLKLIEAGGLDLSPLVSRRVRLSDASAELAAFDGPTPPGVAVITEFNA